MARQSIFSTPTRLWHPTQGWFTFGIGEQDPGASWFEKEGGEPAGAATTSQALKDLIAAQDQIDQRDKALAAKDHDLAQASKAREEAEGKVEGLEQALKAAETERDDAMSAAEDLTKERDAGIQALEALRATITTLEGDLAGASKARDEANENAGLYAEEVQKLGDCVKELEAEVAKVDGDGDGKVGGRKSKPAEPA